MNRYTWTTRLLLIAVMCCATVVSVQFTRWVSEGLFGRVVRTRTADFASPSVHRPAFAVRFALDLLPHSRFARYPLAYVSGYRFADAVKDVGERLKPFKWYDSTKDQLSERSYPDIPSDDPKNRISSWETELAENASDVNNVNNANSYAFSEGFSVLINAIAWGLVVLLVIGVVLGLAWALVRRGDDDEPISVGDEIVQETEAQRVERLPFHIQAARTDLMGEVHRYMQQGNYAQAVIYFYSFLLVELDKYQVIRLEPGRTNGMYVRDVRPYPPLFNAMGATVSVFEDAFFGEKTIDRMRFEQCFQLLPSFQSYLASGGRA